MRRLATELDVGTPTIYWHVGSRDELVAAVIESQAERLAERPVEGRTAHDRVLSAALHIYEGAVEERAITSLAHQTGTSAQLLARLETRSSPNSRPRGSARPRAATRCGRSSSSSPGRSC